MDDTVIPLASDFEPADETAWRTLVEKTLGGGSFERRMTSQTYDGITIEPLYTSNNSLDPLGLAKSDFTTSGRWDIRARVVQPSPAVANRVALEELAGGATSLLLSVDRTGRNGIVLNSPDDLEEVLSEVLLDLAPVALEVDVDEIDVAEWLIQIAEARTLKPRISLQLDPLSNFASNGISHGGIRQELENSGRLARSSVPETTFLASGILVHESGGSEATELGFMLASALVYARAVADQGVSLERAFGSISLGLSVDADYFLNLAKMRAARALWARLTEAATGAAQPCRIDARSSRRMLTLLDPWVNMLRLTAACFGAVTGGANTIALDTFSQPLGRPTAFARRQARNIQLVLMEEAQLGRVEDPASGSWYLETLTRQLAEKAWAFMQQMETAGGADHALETGLLADAVAATRAKREAHIASRKIGIVGVSEFPDLAQAGVEIEDEPHTKLVKSSRSPHPAGPASTCRPLIHWRAAEPFEALRARSLAAAVRPKVFIAALGEIKEHAGRVGFIRNLLASGGIVSDTGSLANYDPVEAAIVVIASSDAVYANEAEAAATTIQSKGAQKIFLAGKPGDRELELRRAGVQSFIAAGADVVALLNEIIDLCLVEASQASRAGQPRNDNAL